MEVFRAFSLSEVKRTDLLTFKKYHFSRRDLWERPVDDNSYV